MAAPIPTDLQGAKTIHNQFSVTRASDDTSQFEIYNDMTEEMYRMDGDLSIPNADSAVVNAMCDCKHAN